MAVGLTSTTFEAGEMIPAKHTCDGDNVSPPLRWTGIPDETESLTLILEDIDSVKGVWSHWVLYDVPPNLSELPEGVPSTESLVWGGVQGRNDFGEIGYGGPCPSDGKAHRYVVRLLALDRWLGLAAGATREDILLHAEGHVVDEASLTGRYKRLADR